MFNCNADQVATPLTLLCQYISSHYSEFCSVDNVIIVTGLCALVATSWYGNKIMVNFHNQHHESQHHSRYSVKFCILLSFSSEEQ